jgi:outer membrane protein OmpA-like peptidoglycan-associated protein
MRSVAKLILALLVLVSLFAAPAPVRADSQTFNDLFFWPATGKNTYLMLQDTTTLHQLQFDVGSYFSYGYRPLDLRIGTGNVQSVIKHTMVMDFVAAMGATEWMQFGLDVPVVFVNWQRSPTAPAGTSFSNFVDLSDIRFEGKARVIDSCKKHIGLAFVPFITFPTGKDSHYVGDPGITGGLKIALDGRINRYLGLTFNVGYQGGKKVVIANLDWQHRLLLGLGMFGSFKNGLDVFGEINTIAAFNKLFNDRDMNPTEIMVGARYDVGKSGVTIKGGAGTCLVCGVKGSRVRAVVGATWRYNPPKMQQRDAQAGPLCTFKYSGLTKSELYRLKATCPDPSQWKAGVHDDVCPKYYEMQDLADLILRCPAKAEDWRKGIHDDACPKVFNLSDNYAPDEVRNIVALAVAKMSLICPERTENWNPQIHDQACPKYYDLEESRELAKKCPPPDQWKEGADDARCPKYYTLHEAYGDVDWGEVGRLRQMDLDRYGAAIAGGQIRTLRPIYFDFGLANIRPEFYSTIDGVVGVINNQPWIGIVRVAGNTDNIGSATANERLSMRRAQAVIEYMRSHGVRPDVQLVPVAYADTRPAASNDTEQGRALNRRVIFTVSGRQGPSYVPPPPTRAAAPPPAPVPQPVAAPPPVPAPQPVVAPAPAPAPQEEFKPDSLPSRWGD